MMNMMIKNIMMKEIVMDRNISKSRMMEVELEMMLNNQNKVILELSLLIRKSYHTLITEWWRPTVPQDTDKMIKKYIII